MTLFALAQGPVAPAAPAAPAPPAATASTSKQVQFAPPSSAKAAALPTAVSPAFACMNAGLNNNQNWHNTDSDGHMRWSMSMSGSGCSVDLRANGVVTFTHEATDIAALTPGGSFDVSEKTASGSRRLEIRPDVTGLSYSYTINGSARAYDEEGRAWLASFLLGLERYSGFAAEVRVADLLARGGADAVLAEISQLRGDYARGRYYARLFDSAHLDAATLRRVLEQAGTDIKSDYELARVLVTVSNSYELADESSRTAFLAAARTINSDYERARVLSELLRRPNLSAGTVREALKATEALKSDYERARVLIGVAGSRLLDDSMVDSYLDAISTMNSDYERARTYIAVLGAVQLTEPRLVKLLQSAGSLHSDYELARVLVSVRGRYPISGMTRMAYLQAADNIQSDRERMRALEGVRRFADM